jgi:hypothetical protein
LRFLAEGPSIPDDLLLARDQGRVIFFCGAGVSRARANLPDFFGLAEKVITALGVPPEAAARKLVQEAREIDRRIGVSGVISADRVFGLLERDFEPRDIEAAVASALKPTERCDLSAHKTLLDLATTSQGVVRLVTTNFDRLFDDCGRNLQPWQPPRLPDPLRPADMNGIVYLHGRVTPQYDGAEGDGFVLSSSEFGRAYLSDGWATSFFREILARYVVVFVGYTADDPPVQYLLEALNKELAKLENVYAFQAGGLTDAAARWQHKGVKAIAYEVSSEHSALWRTLEAWAVRAIDSDLWYKEVIQSAKKGPEALAPHERGQVAHVISTYEGMKKFSEGNDVPPAEWLCVFDSYRRYAKPGHMGNIEDRGPYVDPFDSYGLDSDLPLPKIDPKEFNPKRETPPGTWDAFVLNRLDRNVIRDDQVSEIRGHWAANTPRLISRLGQLSEWIAKVSDQPATVWWAAHQVSLHSDPRNRIQWQLEQPNNKSTPDIRKAWRFLFEAWEHYKGAFDRDWFDLQAQIAKDGWDSTTIRQYAEVRRPYLEAGPNFAGTPKPPAKESKFSVRDLFRRDVKYPDKHNDIHVPDAWVAKATKALRRNLEIALDLETEIGGYGLTHIVPLVTSTDKDNDDEYDRRHGLSAAVLEFSSLFGRLIALDIAAAQQEFKAWPINDDTIFARLRIWAAGKAEFVSACDFGDVIGGLSDEAFWDAYHQRDLLLVLSSRWKELDSETRRSVESRLLSGPTRRVGEDDEPYKERNACSTLNRLHWLSNNRCSFTFDFNEVTQSLQSKAPRWKLEYARNAAASLDRSGWVKTKTDYAPLLEVPLSSILSRAKELSGRTDELFVENDPYAGLAAERPARAFSALTSAAKLGELPTWAWRTFLNPEARKNDNRRLVELIAERLASYSDEIIATLLRFTSDWLLSVAKVLAIEYPITFSKITQKLIDALRLQAADSSSALVREGKKPDWTNEAINAPAGKIAQALFYDPTTKNLKLGKGFPATWLRYVDNLLSLDGDLRRHAIVIFCHNLNWFYAIDPLWTEERLISLFKSQNQYDQDAAWSGFLWSARIPNPKLYARLKADLLLFAKRPLPWRRSYGGVLAGIVLAGWGNVDEATGERFISNDEMRALLLNVDEEFRSEILWQAERWSQVPDDKGSVSWEDLLPEFLEKVWPRQIAAKSPAISARLCDLVFADEKRFPKMAEIVLPLLTKIDQDHLNLPNLRKSKDNIVDLHPKQTLALLDAVLPDNAAAWPYGIEAVIQRIGEADSSLNTDERLIALKRKWDTR